MTALGVAETAFPMIYTTMNAHPPYLDCFPLLTAEGETSMPGSKSVSNRALLLAALAVGDTRIDGLLDSDDTRHMRAALVRLGVAIHAEDDGGLRVCGAGGAFTVATADCFLGNAGTAMRSLTAALAVMHGHYRLHGVDRMHQRPIADLVDALRQLGADIAYVGESGYPPLAIGPCRPVGDRLAVAVRGDVSSQFLSGLLMALPLLDRACEVRLVSPLISRPYVDMTLTMMRQFGVEVEVKGGDRFVVAAGSRYRSPGRYWVEGDASSASYLLAAGAIAGARGQPGRGVTVHGIGSASLQGDVGFARALAQMGAEVTIDEAKIVVRGRPLTGIVFDASDIPDAAMTLAVLALFAKGSTTLNGIGSWRVKETDRIEAMATELSKLGASVETSRDSLTITPPLTWQTPAAGIDTYDDHRIAMCFALAAFAVPLRINDPSCVNKTFPDFFARLDALTRPIPVIAIDGPSASGKGAVAAQLASTLGFHCLDSGALYRLTALAAMRRRVALSDEAACARLATQLQLDFVGGETRLDGEIVTHEIRDDAVSEGASLVAAHTAVRQALFWRQRLAIKPPGLVAEGRDMASTVFPAATLKVYLDAGVEVRAERRHKQLMRIGKPVSMSDLVKQLQWRDDHDKSRAVAPLALCADARYLDTSTLSLDQVVAKLVEWVRSALG